MLQRARPRLRRARRCRGCGRRSTGSAGRRSRRSPPGRGRARRRSAAAVRRVRHRPPRRTVCVVDRRRTARRDRCTPRRRSAGRSACRAAHRTMSTASSTPPMRWNTSHASATCEIRAVSASASPARSAGTPLPSQRAYDCSMPGADLGVAGPSRSASSPGGRAVVGHLLDDAPARRWPSAARPGGPG